MVIINDQISYKMKLFTIAAFTVGAFFTGCIFFAGCTKLGTTAPALKVSLDPSRNVADTFIYRLGDTTRFVFSGTANNVVIYPGDSTHNYNYRSRSLQLGKTQVSFSSAEQYGTQTNTLQLLATDKLPGLDSVSVTSANWQDITSRAVLATSTTATASGTVDLSDLVNGPDDSLFLAFKYTGTGGSTQRTWTITNFGVYNTLPDMRYPRSTLAGPTVAMILTRRNLLILLSLSLARSGRRGIGELHRPVAGVAARVDLEKARAVEAPGETVLAPVDLELAVARAHEGLALPFAAALIHGVDVIELGGERAAQKHFATAALQVPPPLGHPAAAVRIGQRDADPGARIVAETEVRMRRTAEGGQGKQDRRQFQKQKTG